MHSSLRALLRFLLLLIITRNTERFMLDIWIKKEKKNRVILLSNLGLLEQLLIGDAIISVYYGVNGP